MFRSRSFGKKACILTLTLLTVLASTAAGSAPLWHYRVVAHYPHDPHAFTEGLAICGGDLVESDGLYGHSQIAIRTLHTDRLLHRYRLPANVFAEGVTCTQNALVQLTWRRGIAYRYLFDLTPLIPQHYTGEGWGLAFDGHRLILSNGGDALRFYRAADFSPLGAVTVHDGTRPVGRLNELEWSQGLVYANIWHRNRVAVIDPNNGVVRAWLDFSALEKSVSSETDGNAEDVLNGIAYDPDSGHFFVTGKRWPLMFEIRIDAHPNRGAR